MLMEHREEIFEGLENVEEPGLLDLQRVYNGKACVSSVRKRGSGGSGSKEVQPTSLSSGKKKTYSVGQLGKGCSSSACVHYAKGDVGLVQEENVSRVGAGLGGISLKLNGDVTVPKRPRDFVRRKKIKVALGSKEEGVLGSRASFIIVERKLNGYGDGHLHQFGESNGKLDENGVTIADSGDGDAKKVKRHENSDDQQDNATSKSDLIRSVKRENSHLPVHNGDSSIKKARINRKKIKETRSADVTVSNAVKQSFKESSRIGVESQDDEENLEANAARMLSSRFDPSCTGFPSGGKSSVIPFTNGLSAMNLTGSAFDITHVISLEESDVASSDVDARTVPSHDQPKGKGALKKRRYYEVLSRDLDSYWALNRRIKVFWPLDDSWYFGHVIDYDSEKKLHYVKYDDRDEEWIDLQKERFKLLLLPSEVPGKTVRKRSATQDKHSVKGRSSKPADKEQNSCNDMESPIISWLGRSTFHKLPPAGTQRKQRTVDCTASVALPLVCDGEIESTESLEVGSSGQDLVKLVNDSATSVNPSVSTSELKLPGQKVTSNYNRSPVVYFRRRFQKRSHKSSDSRSEDPCQSLKELPMCGTGSENFDSRDLGLDMLQSMFNCYQSDSLCSIEFIWDTNGLGCLKLIAPVTSLKVFRRVLSLPLPFVDIGLFGGLNSMLLQHGALITVWPIIRLEIVFVDNTAGLRVFLFEGCLMQAVSFIFLVLVVFKSFQKDKNVGQPLPTTSARFQFYGLQSLEKQLVFTSYNYAEIVSSKWSVLDRKLSKHCVISKQLPPSACTYYNILALTNVCQLPLTNVSPKHSSVMNVQERSRQRRMDKSFEQSSHVKLSQVPCDNDEKLPPLALSFAPASLYYISLHLKLLMEQSIPSSSFRKEDIIFSVDCLEATERVFSSKRLGGEDKSMNSSVSLDVSSRVVRSSKLNSESCLIPDIRNDVLSADINGVTIKPSCSCWEIRENDVAISRSGRRISQVTESEQGVLLEEHFSVNERLTPVAAAAKVKCGAEVKPTVKIPSLISNGSVVDAKVQNVRHPADSAVVSIDDAMRSPTATQSFVQSSKTGDFSPSTSACLSPGWSDNKQDFLRNGFGNGPKKPRTQVSYSMSLGGHDCNSNNKFHPGKSVSHKRIRKSNEKRTSEAFRSSERNLELLSCDVNILVIVGDRGWRESGARVVLEFLDHNECRLAVKISGETKYSYKAHQFLQPGTTNRYTHAMMWKGGKDWILEFTARSQWTTFKEMFEECYNRNLRAASVKNIPIPGVRLIEENDNIVSEVPYMRPAAQYYRQLETDIEIAMNPTRVLYDMDSDDEGWVMKRRGVDLNEDGCGEVSDEMFEKTMDAFEKLAYAKQHDHFSLDELEEAMASFGPLDAIIIIYKHWREKRQRKGMPLIRHLQPPLWEKYQQQVKEREQGAPSSNPPPSSGCSVKSSWIAEKPAMFAFCLKPRGLEVHGRGSKHRPQKKLPVGVLSNGVPVDPESAHSLAGRRLNGFALGNDRLVHSSYSQGPSDSSPMTQGSARVFSPRYGGGMGYFSLNNDDFERNYYSKPHRNKSKKLRFMSPSNDQFVSYSPRAMDNRNTGHMWNLGSYEYPSQMQYQSDGSQRHNYEQISPFELDEFRLRDAASAARHAAKIAKMKRENAQRMLCRADLAMHKAVAAIMAAEAVKASYVNPNDDDVQSTE